MVELEIHVYFSEIIIKTKVISGKKYFICVLLMNYYVSNYLKY